jgi:hypothetical protein
MTAWIMQDTLPGWCFDEGMTRFLYGQRIRIFDYSEFAQTLREKVRENAERIAQEQGLKIEFIRKIDAFRFFILNIGENFLFVQANTAGRAFGDVEADEPE